MLKSVFISTAAVPFETMTVSRLSVDGATRRHVDAGPRFVLQTRWVCVPLSDGKPSLALRWDVVDSTAPHGPALLAPVLVPAVSYRRGA